MKPVLSTRKPLERLLPVDLATFPLWESANEEEGMPGGEAWVRPMKRRTMPKDAYGLVVSASYRTPAGAAWPGIVSVTTAGAVETSPMALFIRDRQVAFEMAVHLLVDPALSEPHWQKLWNRKDPYQTIRHLPVFGTLLPMRYTLAVLLEGETSAREGLTQDGLSHPWRDADSSG